MKKSILVVMAVKNVIIISFLAITFLNGTPVNAGTYLGSNLVNNENFSSNLDGWREDIFNHGVYSNWGPFAGRARLHEDIDSSLHQTVNIESAKRYRLSGDIATYLYETKIGLGTMYSITNVMSTDLLSFSPNHDTDWTHFLSSEFTSKSVEGIITGYSSLVLSLVGQNGPWNGGAAEFDNISLRQVIYDPQLDIVESDLFITEDMLDGSMATVGLTLNDLSFADTPTSWNIDWGDGAIDYDPVLNSLNQHVYDISVGAQVFTATLYGTNQAGEFSESIQIDVVPEPTTLLLLGLGAVMVRRKR